MYSPSKRKELPEDFGFPFDPYDIQSQLMREVFLVLERKEIAIFESPTGTGKSLTLICAALTWQQQHEAQVRKELTEHIAEVEAKINILTEDDSHVTNWIVAHQAVREESKGLHQMKRLHESLCEHEQRLSRIKKRQAMPLEERRKYYKTKFEKQKERTKDHKNVNLSSQYLVANDDNCEEQQKDNVHSTSDGYRDVQIFFCSRTHTQLLQIVNELKKTKFVETTRCITLASRQQMCINRKVHGLANVALINERCLDMAKCDSRKCRKESNKPHITNCEYKAVQPVQVLSELALTEVLDIEELVTDGKKLTACPYYASRAAQPQAQFVLLPYQMLLHRQTREQNGVDIRGSVIIIDEAHNLLDTLTQMYSCELTLVQVDLAYQQIVAYKKYYGQRFSSSNMLRINQLIYILKSLNRFLSNDTETKEMSRTLHTYQLTAEADFYNLDLFDLLQFCERTRFAQKIHGFSNQRNEPHKSEDETQKPSATTRMLECMENQFKTGQSKYTKTKSISKIVEETIMDQNDLNSPDLNDVKTPPSPIRPFIAFLEALTEEAEYGRVLVNHENIPYLKYILLDPVRHFESIVRDARAIIIAGGTMRPTEQLTKQLFGNCMSRVQQRFYNHVVPGDAVLPFVVAHGPMNKNLRYNYAQRSNSANLEELSMILENFCKVIPDGLVCFLPSYEYLDTVYTFLQCTGTLARISERKRVFREHTSDKKGSLSVEVLLNKYSQAIQNDTTNNGALLLAVVGGKLSEGLNFSDELGRGIIVVGLPYPNRNSIELRERMNYLDAILGAGGGNEYYENICMNAVNQCIGRAVRHIRDYACVYLLDDRYKNHNIQAKLPQWIGRHIKTSETSFGAVQAKTARFFNAKHKF